MPRDTDHETGARKLEPSHTHDEDAFDQKAAENEKPVPYGLTEANDEGAGLSLQSHAQDQKGPSSTTSNKAPEKDAQGQFVKTQHGGRNNGVTSATPRVTTGTDDATFKEHPSSKD